MHLWENFEHAEKILEEYLCAFVNTLGGTLYFGIVDNGNVIGVGCNKEIKKQILKSVEEIVFF